jgi:ubiquinol-cytochrome c reductase iron-sulfur subunit
VNSSHDPSTDLTARSGTSAVPERFEDPGLEGHRARVGDSDPKANKRAERQVVALFTLSILGAIGAVVAYALVPPGETVGSMRLSNLLLGLGLFLSLAGIGAAAVHWAKALMSDHERSEDRHPTRTSDATRVKAVEALREGVKDSSIGRRGVLKGAMVTSLALFPLGIAVPLVGNLGGDWDVSRSKRTMWKKGTKLTIDPSGRPIKAADVTIGSVFHVIPEGLEETPHPLDEKAKAVVLLVRMDPRDLKSEQGEGWSYDGIIAFSKICTHVGCPVALYEQQTHHILCPCHQSTFDAADGAKVVFGPAKRPLPQLPITVDDEGYLVAQDGFNQPIGPSFWERLT